MNEERQTTIKDVANRADVSIATVSRVINHVGRVKPHLRDRVMKAAQELHYVPNNVARSLKSYRTASIAYVISNISDPFFTTIARGIENYIQESGYNLILCSTGHSREREAEQLKLLVEKKVDGIIINTSGFNDDMICEISRQLPVVLSNRRIDSPGFVGDFVDTDNVGSAYELTRRLLHRGYSRIGIINGPLHVSTTKERFRGFCMAMSEAGITVDENYIYRYNENFSEQSGYNGAKYLLSLDPPPQALMICSSALAFGAMQYFTEAGISVPDELSFVCLGDLIHRDLLRSIPTVASVNLMDMGNKMGELLLERVQSESFIPNREIRFSSTYLDGNSV
ncbi:MAG: LacI family DNA-binding transcriptional regulator [Lachnospiraceae bacterium]|nr:LacI family DNA-binding transcriptional regulator [Lachnospiraceae bacterium]